MAECVEVREDQNLRQVEGSRSYWSGAGAEAMRDLVKLLAEEHEVAVEDLICNQCGLYIVHVPQSTTAELSHASKECGSGLSGLWKGVCYHDDGNVWLSQPSLEGWTAFL